MAPDPRTMNAFRAMRDIGIPEEKTKPVLKTLLKLYEKNWEYIEEENYRVLADAIFDAEEIEVYYISFSFFFLILKKVQIYLVPAFFLYLI